MREMDAGDVRRWKPRENVYDENLLSQFVQFGLTIRDCRGQLRDLHLFRLDLLFPFARNKNCLCDVAVFSLHDTSPFLYSREEDERLLAWLSRIEREDMKFEFNTTNT